MEEKIKEQNEPKETKKSKLKYVLALLFILLLGASYFYSVYKKSTPTLSLPEAQKKITDFVNQNLLQSGQTVTVKEASEESGLYKFVLSVGGQEVTTYFSKDGKLFFPQVINTEEKKQAADQPAPVTEVTNKQDVPQVELFVMSYCPYGLQMEKGILPVVQALGNKINFSLKFVDYTLHGQKEVDENLRQYCINKNEPAKYQNYLACFLKAGDFKTCLAQNAINQTQLASCVSATDQQYQITQSFKASGQAPAFNIYKADNDKYGVQGSPTLVINGQTIQSGRDSASILKAICSGFNNQPSECQAQLSSTSPAPGFGSGNTPTSSGANNASCGGQ